MEKTTFAILLCVALLLSTCKLKPNSDDHESGNGDTTVDAADSDIASPNQVYELTEDFVYPITDGSTSTINLDNAVKSAILGGEQTVAHTKTYTSFYNLLDGKCELIFTTPLSKDQLQTMENRDFKHEAEPIAGEGFVFVVNRENPVDTLTIEQLKGIYSGEITNWSEVGGNDVPIIAYQRNADSGSQNYMISFMDDTPLMKPVTDQVPASMSGILDVIAGYDNGIDAIGYSVYAYSDGMYENMSEIKYIKVNGVEPSLTTLADGSYPLLGYNYAVFSADEPEDSNVRALVKWIQSDEGQQVIANAGYIPYRKVDGLTLPEATAGTLYHALGTSGIASAQQTADYDYLCRAVPDSFTTEGLDEAVQAFVDRSSAELSSITEEEIRAYLGNRMQYGYVFDLSVEKTLVNGYLSVTVGRKYNFGAQDSPDYYYDARTAVFDIVTGKQLVLSDLFFDGEEFVPMLNQYLADEAVTPYSGFGTTHDMLRDFTGLYEGDFTFTADSIIFSPGGCFADGVKLSLDGLREHMVTSIPRDMAGLIDAQIPVYMSIHVKDGSDFGYAEEKNGITIWYPDKDNAPISDDVCDTINAFIDKTYTDHFTEEKLLELVKKQGVEADSVSVGPWPDFWITLIGKRYIEFSGANLATALVQNQGVRECIILEDGFNEFYFRFFFNAQTGEELRLCDLFADGWEERTAYYVVDENFDAWNTERAVKFTKTVDVQNCRVLQIQDYESAPYNRGDLTDLEKTVVVYLRTENGDIIAACVPREYILSGENKRAAELVVPVLSSEIHTNITDPAAMIVLGEIYDVASAAGDVSVYFTDAAEEFWFGIGEGNRYHTASTIKPVYCQYLLQTGIDLETEVTLEQVCRSSATGKLGAEDIGSVFTVGELMEYSIRNSDNQAYRLLYETFGIEGYNRYVSSFGSGGLQLNEEWEWSRTTPKKMSRMMLEILRYSEINPVLLDHMKNTIYNGQIPAGTEYETAHKYGSNGGTDGYHDTAIVYAPKRAYILTIMTAVDTAKKEDANAVFHTVAGLCDRLHSVLFSEK